jgi:hypothetical protein
MQGNGILHNASACHVTGQNFQLYRRVIQCQPSNNVITFRCSTLNLLPTRRYRYFKAADPLLYQSWKVWLQGQNLLSTKT